MNYTLLAFFITLIISFLLYYIIPLKFRWIILLLASIIFYSILSTYLIVFLVATVITVYLGALLIQKNNDKVTEENKKKTKRINKLILVLVVLFNLGIIGFLKYYNFFGSIANSILSLFHVKASVRTLNLLLPLGISFYTLEAIGYLIDVSRGKYRACKNFFKVALFLMFFAQVLEGPIARFDQTADQLYNGNKANYKGITFGMQRILWGLFKKMIVADRLAFLVQTISNSPYEYSGIASLLFMLFYTFQLYADFSGFMDIAIGSAEMFGVKLPENFRQPFFAKSAQEFWLRWHITLGAWFKEYVFYSVALSPGVVKFGSKLKKKWRNHFTKTLPTIIALFAVWFCNGLWHGPQWRYIFYGMYYFVIIALGMLLEPAFKKLYQKIHFNPDSKGWQIFRHIRTLFIIFIGETLFGANKLVDAFHILISVFVPYHGSIFALGLDYKEFIVAVVGLIVMLVVGIIKEKGIHIRESLSNKHIVLRWSVYLSLIFVIVIFGAYGNMYSVLPFIYEGF